MKCPNCKERKNIELNIHSDGYAPDTRECLVCGHMWCYSEKYGVIETIKKGMEVLEEIENKYFGKDGEPDHKVFPI